MKIKLKDKYKKTKNIWMKNPKFFILAYNKSKKFNIFKNEKKKKKNIITFYLTLNKNIEWKKKKVRNE